MPPRLESVPTVFISIQWFGYVVRLTSRLGAPFRFTITADSRPSFQRSPIASPRAGAGVLMRSEEHTSELQSRGHIVCRLLLEKKKGDPKLAACPERTARPFTDCDAYFTYRPVHCADA